MKTLKIIGGDYPYKTAFSADSAAFGAAPKLPLSDTSGMRGKIMKILFSENPPFRNILRRRKNSAAPLTITAVKNALNAKFGIVSTGNFQTARGVGG